MPWYTLGGHVSVSLRKDDTTERRSAARKAPTIQGRALLLVISALVAASQTVVAQSTQPPKIGGRATTTDYPTVVDYPAVPSTLAGLIRESTTVIRGTVQTRGRAEPKARAHDTIVIRHHTIVLHDIVKDDLSSPIKSLTIVVSQRGGTALVNNKEVTTPYEGTLLEAGMQVVLFLVKQTGTDVYDLKYGPDSILLLDEPASLVRLPRPLQKMPEFRNQRTVSQADLLQALRRAKEAR